MRQDKYLARKELIWLKKVKYLKGGAYMMSQKLKICKCISHACLTVIWLANSGSIKYFEIIRQPNFIYLGISYFLSINVQSYQRNICEIHFVTRNISRISYLISASWSKLVSTGRSTVLSLPVQVGLHGLCKAMVTIEKVQKRTENFETKIRFWFWVILLNQTF